MHVVESGVIFLEGDDFCQDEDDIDGAGSSVVSSVSFGVFVYCETSCDTFHE